VPSSIIELAKAVDLSLHGPLSWGTAPDCGESGVYFVSLAQDPSCNSGLLVKAPISSVEIEIWLEKAPGLTLDGKPNPGVNAIVERLRGFWLSDEDILYIGKTTRPLNKRLSEFYSHKLGKSSPHRGGHWLKTLDNLAELLVYFACTEKPGEVEDSLLSHFSKNVSAESKSRLWDQRGPVPFANIRRHDGSNKDHGFRKQVE
jgi:hypothetical protein